VLEQGQGVDHQRIAEQVHQLPGVSHGMGPTHHIESTRSRLIDSASLRLPYRREKSGSDWGIARTFSVPVEPPKLGPSRRCANGR